MIFLLGSSSDLCPVEGIIKEVICHALFSVYTYYGVSEEAARTSLSWASLKNEDTHRIVNLERKKDDQ